LTPISRTHRVSVGVCDAEELAQVLLREAALGRGGCTRPATDSVGEVLLQDLPLVHLLLDRACSVSSDERGCSVDVNHNTAMYACTLADAGEHAPAVKNR
jgi:hypothetical protein